MISGRALAALRSRAAASWNAFFAWTALSAFMSAPSDSASSHIRSSGWVSWRSKTETATLGASLAILSLESSGTDHRVPASSKVVVISTWGARAAYFSTLSWPQALPRTVTLLTSMSPAWTSGLPSLVVVGPKTPLTWMP
ncbi:hypothetical protein SFUMM280S_03965 [Streptomyces fumanus]